jgi:hypothetical protein
MTHSENEPIETPIVYVRPVPASELMAEAAEQNIDLPEDATLYAVHTEEGVRMAVFSDRRAAFAAAVDHGAQPVSVH